MISAQAYFCPTCSDAHSCDKTCGFPCGAHGGHRLQEANSTTATDWDEGGAPRLLQEDVTQSLGGASATMLQL